MGGRLGKHEKSESSEDKMLPTIGLRRAVALSSRAQNQRRFGGSLSKNKHIEVRTHALPVCLFDSVS